MSPSEEGARTAAQYDAMAGPYAAFNEVNAANAHYERPATMRLVGELAGRRVLEIGCGAGALTEWMVEEGATVTACDVSREMLALARGRLGARAEFHWADLHDPLSFAGDGGYDLVVASLVLHYLEDWDRVFAELARVLAPGGRVVFSTHHPAWDWQAHTPDDYFATKQVSEQWMRGGRPFQVTFWRRPLREMTRSISACGFVIDELWEPEPLPELAGKDPEAHHELTSRPFFLLFRLLRRPEGDAQYL